MHLLKIHSRSDSDTRNQHSVSAVLWQTSHVFRILSDLSKSVQLVSSRFARRWSSKILLWMRKMVMGLAKLRNGEEYSWWPFCLETAKFFTSGIYHFATGEARLLFPMSSNAFKFVSISRPSKNGISTLATSEFTSMIWVDDMGIRFLTDPIPTCRRYKPIRSAWRDRLDNATVLTAINACFLLADNSYLSLWINAKTEKFFRFKRKLHRHFINGEIVKFFSFVLSLDDSAGKVYLGSSAAFRSLFSNRKHISTMNKLNTFVAFFYWNHTNSFAADLARLSGREQFCARWFKLTQLEHLFDSAPCLLLRWRLFCAQYRRG